MFCDEDQSFPAAKAQWGHEILQLFFAPKTWSAGREVGKYDREMDGACGHKTEHRRSKLEHQWDIQCFKQLETCLCLFDWTSKLRIDV